MRGGPSPIAALLAICALQSAIIAMAQHYMVPGLRLVQPITATMIPPMAWCAFQWTAVRPLERADLLQLLTPLTAAAALLTAPAFLNVFLPATFAAYGLAIVMQSRKGPDAQPRAYLSNGDLPARIWQVIGAVLIISALSDVLIIAAIGLDMAYLKPWIISVFSIGNLLLIGIISLSRHLQTETTEPDEQPRATTDAEQEIWQRVQHYMETHHPYLDPDLTLARLSRKLGIPAKTLSIVINSKTGQNVSRYVNDARIAVAQQALLNGEPVTSAMLSSGFNTKSNFNREFLRITGENPSTWLTQELDA